MDELESLRGFFDGNAALGSISFKDALWVLVVLAIVAVLVWIVRNARA